MKSCAVAMLFQVIHDYYLPQCNLQKMITAVLDKDYI